MKNIAIKTKLDAEILNFITKITEPHKDDHDIKMFNDILNGKRFQSTYPIFKLRIGSARRLNRKIFEEENLPEVFYNEFKVQIRISSTSVHLMATIFHNEHDKTEGISYTIDETINSGIDEETWVLPEGNAGRKSELFFEEILQLLKLNREIKFNSVIEPSEQNLKIHKQFNELMESVTNEQINWITSNELEPDEKITILQNLSIERKLNILENFENENIN